MLASMAGDGRLARRSTLGGGLAALASGLLFVPSCGTADPFTCVSDVQCEGGQCEIDGGCSFPDDACDSGRRYGEHSQAGRANRCVALPEAPGSESGAPPDPSTTGEGGTSLALTSGGSSSGGDPDTTGTTGEAIDPDLLLWLQFDDLAAPLLDSSPWAWRLSCTTCPTSEADGVSGGAGRFEGSDSAATLPWSATVDTPEQFTVAFWVRNDALDLLTIHSVISRPYADVSQNTWEIFFRDEDADGSNDIVFEVGLATPPDVQLIVPVDVTQPWVHIAATWDGQTVSLWVDGQLQAEAAATGLLFDESPLVLAGDIDSGALTHFFVGALDDVRLYQRALSGDEITALQ
jgi:hypothetical protein